MASAYPRRKPSGHTSPHKSPANTNPVATMLVTPRITYRPGGASPTPANALNAGLAGLLDRIAAKVTAAGVTLATVGLTQNSATMLGLPGDVDGLTPAPEDDEPVAPQAFEVDLTEAGWTILGGRIREWTTLTKNGLTVHLCLFWLITSPDAGDYPIHNQTVNVTGDPATWVDALGHWRQITGGEPWYAKSHNAAHAWLRATVRRGRDKREPRWRGDKPPHVDARENAYTVEQGWRGELPDMLPENMRAFLIDWDTSMDYLNAARNAYLSTDALRPTGRDLDWESGMAGWWLIDLAPWPHKHLPDPAGYLRPAGGDQPNPRWVTAPTMGLLSQLRDSGEHPGYTVMDSITNAGTTLLRPWADTLAAAWRNAEDQGDPVAQAIRKSLKFAYKRGIGALSNESSRVYRPDWAAAIIAMARVNLWRRAAKIHDHDGRTLIEIGTDRLSYLAISPEPPDPTDPQWALPKGIPMEDPNNLGHPGRMRWEATREIRIKPAPPPKPIPTTPDTNTKPKRTKKKGKRK